MVGSWEDQQTVSLRRQRTSWFCVSVFIHLEFYRKFLCMCKCKYDQKDWDFLGWGREEGWEDFINNVYNNTGLEGTPGWLSG